MNVSWPQPEFAESFDFQLHVTSTFGANTTHLSWGEHRVEYTARNTYNDKETTCVFYIDVRRTLTFLRFSGVDFYRLLYMFNPYMIAHGKRTALPTKHLLTFIYLCKNTS